MKDNSNCTVARSAEGVLKAGNDFVKKLRRLRRDLDLCEQCPHNDDCKIKIEFNFLVDAAIAEINDEWGMV